jgi:NAD(P)-dependent dehydrogenase (short-subunit alcohol dehydrogenase family)
MPDGGVVITGSAGGVGFAYAGEFMDRGYDVVICDVKDCAAAAKALTARHPNGNVFYTKCDVSDPKSCEALGKFAKDKLGNIGKQIMMDSSVLHVYLNVILFIAYKHSFIRLLDQQCWY